MRKVLVVSLILIISILLVACGGGNGAIPVAIDNNDIEMTENSEADVFEGVPRIESTPTPPLPPTFTPPAMAHQGHLYLLPVSGADGSVQYAYKVRVGDNLSMISDMYDVSMQDVMLVNDISDANHIEVGDLLIIPFDS